jgi:hypothetical protein
LDVPLASYRLHRNYCGILMSFSQYVDPAFNFATPSTPEIEWGIRLDGRPLSPYGAFDGVINVWGLNGFPVNIRLEEGSTVELVARWMDSVNPPPAGARVGGRIIGRYWYNTEFGGAPNSL